MCGLVVQLPRVHLFLPLPSPFLPPSFFIKKKKNRTAQKKYDAIRDIEF